MPTQVEVPFGSVERVPFNGWRSWTGHVDRYKLAADMLLYGERVLDVACGIGYGAQVILERIGANYLGVDRAGVVDPSFSNLGWFVDADLDTWDGPQCKWDVSLCFETLEHLKDPVKLAKIISQASRLVLVSVPTEPTKHESPYHLHDFTVQSLIDLFTIPYLVDVIPQPEERSHIFIFRTDSLTR